MASEFQRVASFGNPAEAHQLKAVLEEQGIRAFVEGDEIKTALSYIGAIGDVNVIVSSADIPAAAEVLEQLRQEADHRPGEAWFCGECQEVVDAGFDVCWKCGQSRDEVEAEMPVTAGHHVAPDGNELDENVPRPRFSASTDAANPFASPRENNRGALMPGKLDEVHDEAEAMLKRAWRASIFGLCGLPIFANLYSMYLLVLALQQTQQFTPEGNTRFYRAFALNIVGGAFWGVILMVLFLRW
ncbi:DUF2007 domain-containing protein [Bremerella sp. JC817]|uniref:putative signal transducing protein n=1 Tax=Bremerella sp. JC817 TaxID=3231756 RepID=UPI003459725C